LVPDAVYQAQDEYVFKALNDRPHPKQRVLPDLKALKFVLSVRLSLLAVKAMIGARMHDRG
jgi:hypothetical protein